jgi:phosphatidylinositol 4-kinase
MNLSQRFIQSSEIATKELDDLIMHSPTSVCQSPLGVSHLLAKKGDELRYLLTWIPVSPIEAIALIGPQSSMHPWVIQYAIFVLEYFPADQVFFYIPQIVQSLRYDTFGSNYRIY